MKFKSADDVRTVIEKMRETDIRAHSTNRARINELFDGFPPFSDEEAEANNIGNNINFLEAPNLAHKARSTWNNAFLKPNYYFTVTLDSGPVHRRTEWSHIITRNINRPMKRSLRYIEAHRATGAQVIMHGPGPKHWESALGWLPKEVGIEDLLVPSGTKVNLENLSHFAIYRRYTPEELFSMTHGKQVDPGWNMKVVDQELKRLAMSLIKAQDSYQDTMNPEKLVSYYKNNAGFLDTDAVPTCNVWQFFYQEEDGKIYKKMVLEDVSYSGSGNEYLYNPRRPFAANRSQVLHIQFGDGANIAPFLYHNVRSLGYLLYAVCHLQNRLRCRFADAIFEATLQYFRANNADDRARVQKVDLQHLGLVPNGLEFIPREQRWEINGELMAAGLAQNKQLMGEAATSFVQDIDTGTGKELTATEVMARLNSANALVSSLLSMAYTYAEFEYREIARRFCNRKSNDRDIEEFRFACLKAGVPNEYLNSERWEIEPERVMGGGNKTLELAQSKALMEVRQAFDPEAQREILRDYALAVTDDADKADRWVPLENKSVTPAEHDAQLAVGALMNLAPVGIRQGIDHIGYTEAFLLSMQSIVQDVSTIGQPTMQQVLGLMACYKHISGHIAILAQNPEEQQRVKTYGDFLKPVMNQVKIWAAQLDKAQAAAAQQNGDGGKMAATVIQAQSKAQIAQQSAVLKEQRKDMAFTQEQKRRNLQAVAELERQHLLTSADVERQAVKTSADVASTDLKTAAELRKQRLAAEAASAEGSSE